jgi:hypothetical protein
VSFVPDNPTFRPGFSRGDIVNHPARAADANRNAPAKIHMPYWFDAVGVAVTGVGAFFGVLR